MKKYLDAARRQLRTDKKSIFFFGEGENARLFTSHGPWSKIKKADQTAIIMLPPFAEEMNRCRRLLKLTQDALAAAGLCSLSVDYLGTGDSAGHFSQARLADWETDVENACAAARHAGASSITLLGFRFGALLAADVAHKISDVKHIYAVAPQESFQRAIRQFVRIATTMSDLNAGASPGLRAPGAAKRLANGEAVEIGGYDLSPDLYGDFMKKRSAKPTDAGITAVFVSNPINESETVTPPEARQLAGLGAYSDTLFYTHVTDSQMWYQGVPEEPGSLPQAISDLVTGAPVKEFDPK